MEPPRSTLPRRETQSSRLGYLPSNLRGRFLAVLFGVLLPSLTLFGFLHHDSVKRSLLREVDQTLVNRAREVEHVLTDSGVHRASDISTTESFRKALIVTAAPEVFVTIQDVNGKILWSSQNFLGQPTPASPPELGVGPSFRTVSNSGGPKFRQLTEPVKLEDGTVVVLILAESLEHTESALAGSIGRTVLLGLVILTLTELAGNYAFRGIFTPLKQLVDTTETIVSTDDVTRRVPVYLDADPEIKRTALAFNSLMDRVEQLLEMAKRLLADTSHELRNPLTVILTDLDLLREDLTPEQREEVISEAQSTVRRLTRLVSDLLLLSRTEAHSEVLEVEAVDVIEFVEKLAARISRSLNEMGEICFLRPAELKSAVALINEARTEQILSNLFENGIRYSGDHRVEVRISLEETNIVISVKDNGCGIPPEEQEKIFHRFYRVDRSRDRHSGGTGLGLAVARALARLQGGDIRLESQPGEGSDFQLVFPAAPTEAE